MKLIFSKHPAVNGLVIAALGLGLASPFVRALLAWRGWSRLEQSQTLLGKGLQGSTAAPSTADLLNALVSQQGLQDQFALTMLWLAIVLTLLILVGLWLGSMLEPLRVRDKKHSLREKKSELDRSHSVLEQKIQYVNGILASVQSGLMVINADGLVQDCNPALEALTGQSRQALLGQPCQIFFDPEPALLADFFKGLGPRLRALEQANPAAVADMLMRTPLACLRVGADGSIVMANPRASQLTGYIGADLCMRRMDQLLPDLAPGASEAGPVSLLRKDGTRLVVDAYWVHPDAEAALGLVFLRSEADLPWCLVRASALGPLVESDDEDAVLAQLRHADRSDSTPVRVSVNSMLDAQGRVTQTVINLYDVSSLLHKNDAIRQQNSLLEKTMEAMQDGVLQIDRTGLVVNANPKSLDLLSRDKMSIVGRSIEQLFLPGHPLSRFPNWIPVNHSGVVQDIRDHDPDNFWLLLRELPHPVLGFDALQNLRFINVAACQLLGVEEDTVLEQPFAQCVGLQDGEHLQAFIANPALEDAAQPPVVQWQRGDGSSLAMSSSFQRLGVGNQTWTMVCLGLSIEELKAMAMKTNQNVEWKLTREDEESIPVVLTAAPLRNSAGQISGAVITLKDMREIKEKEAENVRMVQQMEQSQRLDALGQLAAGVAHDFNNLLGVIQNHAELVEMKVGPESKATRNLSAILQATTRARDIVIKLNGLGRDQVRTEEVIEAFDLAPLLDETQTLLQATLKGIDIAIEHASAEAAQVVLMGDSGSLQQVLVNLCVNASHAIGERRNGRIILYVSRYQSDKVRVAVIDNGSGIPPATLPRIFEPFFTTKEVGKGTGLGLAMVRSIVTKMGGTIDCESEVGVGTSFIVTLPVAA
jgi:signal transduction histidine kinase